ncbi:AraC-type DNA-binding protein [Shewanella morhuae]|uniref:AraC family transcriptional regulator n=1 Tax=Shewanella morhuae TaxID=365591 RepID=UPI00095514C7|nr:AraC family transcriptional regulator [Shewanella morhuae]SIR40992.1 AraC-type DNA-binding protein [Shewanella morhuae]
MNDSQKTVASTQELAKQIDKWMANDENQLETQIPGLKLTRWPHVTSPTSYIHPPSICLIAQGKKRVLLGDESYIYDDNHFLVSSVGLPVIANIIEASDERPYLGLVLELDLLMISELIAENQHVISHDKKPPKGMAVGQLSASLLNAFTRLINLLDESDNIKVLAPIIQREIFFRILTTAQGRLFHQIVTVQSHSHQISKAIDFIRNNFHKQINISELADYSGMSLSAFYTHFRSVTAMTPLQFQKSLRLNEARRLMLTENLDAMTTTFKVGYESPSQFSREYRRFFGQSPLKDTKALRETEQH